MSRSTPDVVVLALGILLFLSGCAGSLRADWAPDELLVFPDAEAYDGEDAVILLDELEVRYVELPRDLYQERAIHRVTAILTEDGVDAGDVRVVYPKRGQIVSFEARTIAPDGKVASVEPEKVFDDESKDKDGYSVRTASLPKVAAGSIVEYKVVIRYPYPYSADWETISGEHPIKKYRVYFTGPKSFAWQAQAYNFPENTKGWVVEQKGRDWHLSIEVDDVPSEEDESYRPSSWDTEPRWAFVVRQYRDGTQVYNWNYDWKYALEDRGVDLYFDHQEWYAGFDPDVDVSACEDIRCKIDACFDWLNERVELQNFGGWPGRPAKEVLDAKVGFGFERNRMMYRMLEELDIEARFAFARTRHAGPLDKNMPIAGSMNLLILYLPEQDGLREPLFVDATCEWCAAGQLPAWILGQEVALLHPKKDRLENTVDLEWMTVTGEPAPAEKFEYRVQLAMDETGTVRGEVVSYGRNRSAHGLRSDTVDWDEDDWKLASRRMVKDRATTIQVVDYDRYARPPVHEAQRGVRIEAPGVGVRDGDNWLIPLTLLSMGWDDVFEGKPSGRDHDVRFQYANHAEEILELKLPDGYEVRELPPDMEAGRPPLQVSARFERTPDGVRVRREVKVTDGIYDRERYYPQLRETLDAFREIRTRTLIATPQGSGPVVRATTSSR